VQFLKLRSPAFPRPAFGGLLMAVLLLMTVSELALGIATYWRLRSELESDLAQGLANVARLLALGTVPLITQFREGDERIPAYQLVVSRFVATARAAGVERVYIVDDRQAGPHENAVVLAVESGPKRSAGVRRPWRARGAGAEARGSAGAGATGWA
jgi:hypothetical protein